MGAAIFGETEGKLVVDVWSDVMCPFCYMGDTLLAQAIEQFEHGSEVEVRYHSFLLMPELPSDRPSDLMEILVERKGFPREQAEAMNAQVTARGKAIGLDYRFDRAVAINSRTAHRLSHFAASEGRQHAMVHRLFKAYFTDGLNVGDHAVLADLAAEVGLDRDKALHAIESGAFEEVVDEDIRQARELGISGVPFFVLGGKYGVSGAQPVEAFLQALQSAWADRAAV